MCDCIFFFSFCNDWFLSSSSSTRDSRSWRISSSSCFLATRRALISSASANNSVSACSCSAKMFFSSKSWKTSQEIFSRVQDHGHSTTRNKAPRDYGVHICYNDFECVLTCWCFLSISTNSFSTFTCLSFTLMSSSSLACISSSWRVTWRRGFTCRHSWNACLYWKLHNHTANQFNFSSKFYSEMYTIARKIIPTVM